MEISPFKNNIKKCYYSFILNDNVKLNFMIKYFKLHFLEIENNEIKYSTSTTKLPQENHH